MEELIMIKKEICGVIISPLTPFTEDGVVDDGALSNLIEFHISKKVHGFLALATAGEGPLLTVEERKHIAEVIIRTNAGRLPIIVQCGTLSTKDTVELAKHAVACGADAVATLPPLYSRLDFAAYEMHFQAVADAVHPVPLFIYNNPWAQGRALTVEELVDLNAKGIIQGVIDSSRDLGNIYKLMRYRDKITTIIADTKLSMPGLLFGCPALGSAIGNAIPELFVDMYNAVQTGDIQKAVTKELEVFAVSEKMRSPECGAIHEALNARGQYCGYPKRPIRTANEDEKKKIHEAMRGFVR
jgi:dihydrodipicolinate synthase/N-acetylneuraminate lyase